MCASGQPWQTRPLYDCKKANKGPDAGGRLEAQCNENADASMALFSACCSMEKAPGSFDQRELPASLSLEDNPIFTASEDPIAGDDGRVPGACIGQLQLKLQLERLAGLALMSD